MRDLQVVVGFYQMEIRTSHYQCSISSHANFFLIRTWSDLLIIVAPSLIANSCRLIFNGLIPSSTSSAYLPLVAYESRHKHRAFLCTSSNNLASAFCQTGHAYSNIGQISDLYSCTSFRVLIFPTCLICLKTLIALFAFCSVFFMWFWKFNDSSK